jgi:hypothetical protein
MIGLAIQFPNDGIQALCLQSMVQARFACLET